MRKPLKRLAGIALRAFLILVALAPFGITLYREWPAVQVALFATSWEAFAIGQVLFLPVMLMMALVPWLTLQYLARGFSFRKAAGIYFATQLLKYLPGGIWAFPGRMVAYELMGLGRAGAMVAVFRETTAYFLGAATVGLMGLIEGISMSASLRWGIGIGTLACMLVILLTHMPWFWRFLSSFRIFKIGSVAAYAEINQENIRIAWLPRAYLASLFFWLLVGLPFRQMALAAYPFVQDFSWLGAASVFALSWCAGFVVLFAPAGIGIREGALTVLLIHFMPVGAALSLALLSRFAWMVAEGSWVLITWWWVSKDLGRPLHTLLRQSSPDEDISGV